MRIHSIKIVFCLVLVISMSIDLSARRDTIRCMPERFIPEKSLAFGDGEFLKYVINYKWLGVRTDVGEAEVNIKEIAHNGRRAYHAVATGKTYKFWDVFFKVRDLYESKFYGDNLKPIYFHRDVKEGRYEMINIFRWNDFNNNIDAHIARINREPRDTVLIGQECTADLITLFYFARNLDFDSMTEDVKYPISFVIDEDIFNIYFIYMGREEKKLPGFGKVMSKKFALKLIAGEVFTGEKDMYLWVSDDENNIPLLIESPILVGAIQGRLVDYKNVKFSLTEGL